jgi:HPt (histidine-containing phosphotransfer) domain-containing protein
MISQTFLETPLIDEEQFAMLVETGEEMAAEMLTELIDLFETEMTPRMSDLHQFCGSGSELMPLTKLAHAIAGSSGNLGCMRLSTMARYLENHISGIPLAELPAWGKAIEALYLETLETYKQRITELGA